jgi:hypothetical protein
MQRWFRASSQLDWLWRSDLRRRFTAKNHALFPSVAWLDEFLSQVRLPALTHHNDPPGAQEALLGPENARLGIPDRLRWQYALPALPDNRPRHPPSSFHDVRRSSVVIAGSASFHGFFILTNSVLFILTNTILFILTNSIPRHILSERGCGCVVLYDQHSR